jgi:hypothetical protein
VLVWILVWSGLPPVLMIVSLLFSLLLRNRGVMARYGALAEGFAKLSVMLKRLTRTKPQNASQTFELGFKLPNCIGNKDYIDQYEGNIHIN